ncbi:MAG: hypothetical protein OEY40_03050 [Candidatus Bathyarchaeota archaeon]|nr:hypothetical protein [Candidatus Bathyarchaeota archaeon]
MERQGLKQIQPRMIDLTKIEGNEDFPYPNRRVTISPEDQIESVYSVLEAKIQNMSLEELVIASNECVIDVRFVGFLSIRRR